VDELIFYKRSYLNSEIFLHLVQFVHKLLIFDMRSERVEKNCDLFRVLRFKGHFFKFNMHRMPQDLSQLDQSFHGGISL
jgi:hypothetical protein